MSSFCVLRQFNAEHEAAHSGEFARDSNMGLSSPVIHFQLVRLDWDNPTNGCRYVPTKGPKSTFAPPFRSTLFLNLSS